MRYVALGNVSAEDSCAASELHGRIGHRVVDDVQLSVLLLGRQRRVRYVAEAYTVGGRVVKSIAEDADALASVVSAEPAEAKMAKAAATNRHVVAGVQLHHCRQSPHAHAR